MRPCESHVSLRQSISQRCRTGCGRWVTTPDITGDVCLTCDKADKAVRAASRKRAEAELLEAAALERDRQLAELKLTAAPARAPVCRLCGECFETWAETYAHKCRLAQSTKEKPLLTVGAYLRATRGE